MNINEKSLISRMDMEELIKLNKHLDSIIMVETYKVLDLADELDEIIKNKL